MISLRLNADTSDAVRNVNNLGNSIEDLQRKLKAAQDNGNWSEAAKITQDIAFMQNPGFSVVGGKGNNGGSNLANTQNYNNARQLDLRLETITRVITTLTDQLKESTEKGQSKDSFNISAALNNAEQERRQLEAEKRRLETSDKSDMSAMDMIKKYGMTRYLTQGMNYFNQISGIGFNHRIAMANGDYLGADVAALESGAGVAQGVGGSLLGAGLMLGATPVGWGLMAAGGILEAGGGIAKYIAGDERADIAEGEAYRKTLAGTNGLNKRFSNAGSDWLANARQTSNLLSESERLAEGTGMTTDEFINLATQQTRFGTKSSSEAMAQARQIALWANSTGTNAGTIQALLGTARRYGDNSDVLGYASQARQAAGLTKAQNEEFLNSLQRVIEEGISNGYVKSTEDVSKTFVMFSRLSDNNPLWQGEQGAKRLAQMNNGISGATALQSTSDVIVAMAARDVLNVEGNRNKLLGKRATGTYIDEMLLMEQGTNPAMFGAIANSVESLEGSNYAAKVERYKDIFKLNYAGAVDVAAMASRIGKDGYTEEQFAKDVANMQKDPVYKSEETKWQDNVNKIETNVALMAQSKFWESLNKLKVKGDESEKDLNGGSPSNGTNITEKALASASSEEIALKAAEAIEKDSTVNPEILETPLGQNFAAEAVSQELSKLGDYSGAVRSHINDEKGLTFANLRGYKINDDSVFAHLYSEGVGNDELDKLAIDEIGKYAALGYKKGGFLGIGKHKADGIVDEGEIDDAIRRMDDNKSLKKAYESGDSSAYLRELRALLTDLFGNITLNAE